MNKTTGKPGVYFQDTLPVLWTNTGRPLKESDLHHQHQANEMLLAALLALDETTAEREEDEIARGKEHHWQRIDSKLNLLLSLVSEVLVKQLGIPPCRDVRLCATQIEISLLDSDQPPRLGELLELRTYLQAAIPKPLILNGKVESLGNKSFVVKFVSHGDAQRELLEKFVFRQHRRAIAQARGSVKFHT